MQRRLFTLDFESTLHNDEVGKFKAHPQSAKNWAVWAGMCLEEPGNSPPGHVPMVHLSKFPTKEDYDIPCRASPASFMLIGHNVGFDIHYACNVNNKSRDQWIAWLNHPDSLIWDTQLAEYRLKGQTVMSPSLDLCCEARKWSTKPGRLKEYWAQGISTEDIPDDEVRPYLEHDVATTHRLFKDQIMEAQRRGMLQLILIEMKSRMTTILMEHNGMSFDSDGATRECEQNLIPKHHDLEVRLLESGIRLTGLPRAAISPNSPAWLKSVLFGGPVKWKEQLPMTDPVTGDPVTFRTGKRKGEIKLKWQEFENTLPALSPVDYGTTAEETLQKIIVNRQTSEELKTFLEDLLAFRDLGKQIGTYYTGYSQLTWADGMIHGNLNHCITMTGRLSSSHPNLQNAAHSPIRQFFRSRYKGGKILEIDLSQIEVVAQAVLSQDSNMIADIVNKIDFHSKRAAFAHGASYEFVKEAAKDETHPEHKVWKQHRKDAKIVSFQKAYGAGVKKISETTGLPPSEVKAFMNAEDKNYPNVPVTQQRWIDEVTASTAIRDGRVSGILVSPTKAEYRFFQQEFNGHLTFKPTEIKNYPIQGLSADLLKIIMSELRRVVWDYNHTVLGPIMEKVLLVNTVHDSVVLDVPGGINMGRLARTLLSHFTQYPITVLKDKFGFDFNCPISAEAEAGDDWYNKVGVH